MKKNPFNFPSYSETVLLAKTAYHVFLTRNQSVRSHKLNNTVYFTEVNLELNAVFINWTHEGQHKSTNILIKKSWV
jgi:hypothetical protein